MITKQAYSEVYTVLNMMSETLRNKISQNVLNGIDNKRDKQNIIKVNNIKQLNISKQAEEVLAVLYRNYLATDDEKKIIKAKERILFEKKQEELRKKYNTDNIFKNRKK